MQVNKINKGLAALVFLGIALTALVGCAPAKAEAMPTDTPAVTQIVRATNTPSPIPTYTPQPTPKLTKEEALRKLNITSDFIYCMSDMVVFECTLKSGENKYLVVYTTYKTGEGKDGFLNYEMLNVTDNEVFATFTANRNGASFINMMDSTEITLVPEFLQGATINTTYQFISIPSLYDALERPVPESKYIDYIIETSNTNPELFHERRYTSEECADIILELIPMEYMVWASDYIKGFVESTPKVK